MPEYSNIESAPVNWLDVTGKTWQITGLRVHQPGADLVHIDSTTGRASGYYFGELGAEATGVYATSGQFSTRDPVISWSLVHPATNQVVNYDYSSDPFFKGFEISVLDLAGNIKSGIGSIDDGRISSVQLISGGSGYINPSIIVSGDGTGAAVEVETFGTGVFAEISGFSLGGTDFLGASGYKTGISAIRLVSGGSGYTQANTHLVISGSGNDQYTVGQLATRGQGGDGFTNQGSGAFATVPSTGFGLKQLYFNSSTVQIPLYINKEIFGGDGSRNFQVQVVARDYYDNSTTGRIQLNFPSPKFENFEPISTSNELVFGLTASGRIEQDKEFIKESVKKIEIHRGPTSDFPIVTGLGVANTKIFAKTFLEDGINELSEIRLGQDLFDNSDYYSGYFYKLLPYDNFGTGDTLSITTGIRISRNTEIVDVPSGFRTLVDQSKAVGTNIQGDVITNTYLSWKKDKRFNTQQYEVVIEDQVEKESYSTLVSVPQISGISHMVSGTGSGRADFDQDSLLQLSSDTLSREVFDIFQPYSSDGIQWSAHTVYLDSEYLGGMDVQSIGPTSIRESVDRPFIEIPAGNTASGYLYYTGVGNSITYSASNSFLEVGSQQEPHALVARNINGEVIVEYEPRIKVPTKKDGSYSFKVRGITNKGEKSLYGDTQTFTASGAKSHFVFNPINANLEIGGTGTIASSGPFVTTVGGKDITAVGTGVVLVGGMDNSVTGELSALVGGSGNRLMGAEGPPAEASFMGGGRVNVISGFRNVLVGGEENIISGDGHALLGGRRNSIFNSSADQPEVFEEGQEDNITYEQSVIGGGIDNIISGVNSFVGGGNSNQVGINLTRGSGVFGVEINVANPQRQAKFGVLNSAIVGGRDNEVYSSYGFIGGGYGNRMAEGNTSVKAIGNVIAGGRDNLITGNNTEGTVILGGRYNHAEGAYGIVGGYGSSGDARYGLALGTYAYSNHEGAMVLADGTTPSAEGGSPQKKSHGTNTLNLFFDNGTYLRNGSLFVSGGTTISGGAAAESGHLSVQGSGYFADGIVFGDGTTQTTASAGGGGGAVSAVANGANNRVATFSSSDALNGEANLTFDGTQLLANGNVSGLSGYFGKVGIGVEDIETTARLQIQVDGSERQHFRFTNRTSPITSVTTYNPALLIGRSDATSYLAIAYDSQGLEYAQITRNYVNARLMFMGGSNGATQHMMIDGGGKTLIGEGIGAEALFTVSGDASITGELKIGDSSFVKGNFSLHGVNSPYLHIDGLVDAYARIDRGAANRQAYIAFQTAGSENWVVGVPDSDNWTSSNGGEFYIGQNTDADNVAPALVIDETNNYVGIGDFRTAMPHAMLTVSGDASITGELRANGNLGIGAASPVDSQVKIYASENTVFDASQTSHQRSEGATLNIYNASDTVGSFAQVILRNRSSNVGGVRIASLADGNDNSVLRISVGDTTQAFSINGDGEALFGEGQSQAGAKLTVSGDASISGELKTSGNLVVYRDNGTSATDTVFEVEPNNNRIRLRDHAYVSGNLYVSGAIISADDTVNDHISGLSGYFGRIGIGTTAINNASYAIPDTSNGLQIWGNDPILRFQSEDVNTDHAGEIQFAENENLTHFRIYYDGTDTHGDNGALVFGGYGSAATDEFLVIDRLGKVSIGAFREGMNSAGQATLTVSGDASITGELKVAGNIGVSAATVNHGGWTNTVTLDGNSSAAFELAKSETLYGWFGVQGAGSNHAVDIAHYQGGPIRLRTSSAGATSDQFIVDPTATQVTGDLRVNSDIVMPQDKYLYFEGDADDAFNRIGRNNSENAILTTSRFHIANIIDSNNDDTTAEFSVRHNGTTIAGSTSLFSVNAGGTSTFSHGGSLGGEFDTTVYIDTYNSTGDNSSTLALRKSRNNTVGVVAQTVDGDSLGAVQFHGVRTDSAFITSSHITAIQNGAAGGTYVPSDLVFTTSTDSAVAEKVRITKDGLVGIGTAVPSGRLHVNNAGTGIVVANETITGNAFEVFGAQGNLLTVTDDLSDSLFSVNDAAGMPVFEVFADDTIKSYRNNESKFEIDPDNNRIRLRDNAYVSGDLYVSGSVITADGTSPDHISGLSGYFGKVGIGSSSIDALTDGSPTRLQISHPDESFAVNLRAMGSSYIPSLALSSDRPSSNQEMGKIKWLNNGASPVAQIKAIRGSSDTVGHLNFQTSNADAMQIWSDQKVQIASTQNVAPQATLVISGDASITGETRIAGNVGIGVAPSNKLHVEGSASSAYMAYIKNTHASAGYGLLIDAGDDNNVSALAVRDKDGTARMIVRGGGNVGIGTGSPSEKLEIYGNGAALRFEAVSTDQDPSAVIKFAENSSTDNHFRIEYDGSSAHDANGALIFGGFGATQSDEFAMINREGQMMVGNFHEGINGKPQATFTVSGDASITGELKVATHVSGISGYFGKVGIGTSTWDGPNTTLLQVDGDIRLGDGDHRNIIGPTNATLGIYSNPNDSNEGIKFSTDGGSTIEMFLEDGGNVGIGPDLDPTSRLHVNSAGEAFTLRLSSTASRAGMVIDHPSTTDIMGSALVLASDNTYRLGTALYYHVSMTQAGGTELFGNGSPKMIINPDGQIIMSSAPGFDNSTSSLGAQLTVSGDTSITGELRTAGNVGINTVPTGRMHIYQSGDSQPAFLVEGSQGSLFSVEDTLTGSLMSVNDIAGLPVFEAFDDGTIVMGQYNSGDFVVTGNNVGIGTSAPTSKLHVTSSDTNNNLILESTDASATTAPDLVLYRNSASAADDDYIGVVRFRGKNDNGTPEDVEYGAITSQVKDASDGTEDGELALWTMGAGTLTQRLSLDKDGQVVVGSTAPKSTLHVDFTRAGEHISAGITVSNINGQTNDFAPIYFGNHGGDRRKKAGIGLKRLGSFGRGSLHFAVDSNADDADVSFANDTKMVIDQDGKVGIGTVSPNSALEVSGQVRILDSTAAPSYGARLVVGRDTAQCLKFTVDDGNCTITADQDSDSNGNHRFILDRTFDGNGENTFEVRKDGTTQLLIDTDGQVGIGIISPKNLLTVKGKTTLDDDVFVSGDLTVSGAIEYSAVTASTHVSGLSGYFGKIGIGSSTIDEDAILQVTKPDVADPSRTEVARFLAITDAGNTNSSLRVSSAVAGSQTSGRYVDLSVFDHNPTSRPLILQRDGGQVGIGTSIPDGVMLKVNGDASITGELRVNDNVVIPDGNHFKFSPGGDTFIHGSSASDFIGAVISSEQFRIDSTATQVTGDLRVAEYIRHGGDDNTYQRFEADKHSLVVGGFESITTSTAGGGVTINEGGNDVNFRVESQSNIAAIFVDAANDLVGFGTSSPSASYRVTVNGGLAADFKSFIIDHPDPAKPDKQLAYASSETPEHNVFVRGKAQSKIIELPDHWPYLVHEDSISVQLTPIGEHQELYVESIKDNKILINNSKENKINCFYLVHAERKDINKLETEPYKSVKKEEENGK